MMVGNETYLFRELRKAISPIIYDAFDEDDFYEEILYNKTLIEYSIYFPYWIREVEIKKHMAIKQIDPITGHVNEYAMYRIPNYDPQNIMFLDVDNIVHPYNDYTDVMGFGLGSVAESAVYKTVTTYNQTRTMVKENFRSPDLVYLTPTLDHHVDFAIDVKCRALLSSIPSGLWYYFVKLFICDVKIDIYNSNPNLRDGNINLGGIEINSRIDSFADAVNEKNEILELFNNNYYKEPETYKSQMVFQKKIF